MTDRRHGLIITKQSLAAWYSSYLLNLFNFQFCQQRQALLVNLHKFCGGSWNTAIAIQEDSFWICRVFIRKFFNRFRPKSLNFYQNWVILILDPIFGWDCESKRFVVPIDNGITAILLK